MTFMEFMGVKVEVRRLIEVLSKFSPDEHLAVLFYEKDEIDANIEGELSQRGWEIVCEKFAQNETIDMMAIEFLQEQAQDYAEVDSKLTDAKAFLGGRFV